ncbi:MAG TPA: VanZ family protein [Calditrichaeota bacterium]|nr:VanZ family protein [Calditrichota bacterium]
MMHFIRWHLPWLAMMGLIFWLSSIPDLNQSVFVFELSDKLIHFLVFGILGWLTARGLNRCTMDRIQKHYLLIAGVVTIIFAASDEWHQSFVPGRYADWLDWLADTLGIIVFIFVYSRFKQI